jgi:Major Facilitator Superfamily
MCEFPKISPVVFLGRAGIPSRYIYSNGLDFLTLSPPRHFVGNWLSTMAPSSASPQRALSPVDVEKPTLASVSTSTCPPFKLRKHAQDADEAIQAFKGREGEVIEIDEASNKRLLRRIDWNLIALMCVVYGLNYLDKTTLSYASVMGLQKDIGLKGDDYQWLGSMFFWATWLGSTPPADCSRDCHLPNTLPSVPSCGALPSLASAAVHNFSGAVAIRLFLGVFEAAMTPGFALFTSQWYTKKEQGTRVGIRFSFNGWAQTFGGFVAYGIAVGVRKHGTILAPWKIVFLVTGCLAAFLGIVFWFVIPDNQLNARWMKKEGRILAIERVRINRQGIGNKHFKWYQLKEALMDPIICRRDSSLLPEPRCHLTLWMWRRTDEKEASSCIISAPWTGLAPIAPLPGTTDHQS